MKMRILSKDGSSNLLQSVVSYIFMDTLKNIHSFWELGCDCVAKIYNKKYFDFFFNQYDTYH